MTSIVDLTGKRGLVVGPDGAVQAATVRTLAADLGSQHMA